MVDGLRRGTEVVVLLASTAALDDDEEDDTTATATTIAIAGKTMSERCAFERDVDISISPLQGLLRFRRRHH